MATKCSVKGYSMGIRTARERGVSCERANRASHHRALVAAAASSSRMSSLASSSLAGSSCGDRDAGGLQSKEVSQTGRGGTAGEGSERNEADSPPQTSPVHLGCAWRSILRGQRSCELGTATERAAAGLTKIPRRSYPLRDRKTLLVLPSVLPRPERRGRAENVESGAHLLVLDRLQSRARQLVPHDRIGPQVALERDEGELDAWTVVANLVDPLIAC